MPLPLFEYYPQLINKLPYSAMADLPTPVQSLSNIDASRAWVKRDDICGTEYGGNKIRKLEFILADIKARQKTHVFTFGAIGTNAGVATALMCKQNDLRSTIYLFDQPVTDTVLHNLSAMQAYGAELIYAGSLLKAALHFYLSPHRLNPSAYFLYAGCSNPPSVFAYINAAFELKQQIDQGVCPEPAAIHVPVGSCATLAGLTLGAQLAGLKSSVKGTRVAPSHVGPFSACSPNVVDNMIATAANFLKANVDALKDFKPIPCTMLNDEYGTGYGQSTPESLSAMNFMKEREGLMLETTYSGKSFSAFLKDLKKGNGPILFWNTYNSRAMTHKLDVNRLPKPIQNMITN